MRPVGYDLKKTPALRHKNNVLRHKKDARAIFRAHSEMSAGGRVMDALGTASSKHVSHDTL